MKNATRLSGFIAIIILLTNCTNNMKEQETFDAPPQCKKIKKEFHEHGNVRIDNYYWLNQRSNPEVVAYLEEENKYTDKVLGHTKDFQEKLFKEIVARISPDDVSVPVKDNGFYYYDRYEEGKEYPFICRKKDNLETEESIIFDVNEMAQGFDYYELSDYSVSPDNNMVAFAIDTLSRRLYTIVVKDINTGEIFSERIDSTDGAIAWANDNKTFFYVRQDESLRSYCVMKHVLGTDPNEDKVVFNEKDETFNAFVSRSKSDKIIYVGSSSNMADEYWYLNADNTDTELTPIHMRKRGIELTVYDYKDEFYILTNFNALNFKLVKTKIDNPAIESWKEVIPHRDNALINGVDIFKKFLVLEERIDGLNQIRIIEWATNNEYYIEFDEETYSAWSSSNPDFETDVFRLGYYSLTTPLSYYDYNMVTKEKTLLKRKEVVGGYNPEDYKAGRVFALANDSTRIPISLVYKKSLKKEEGNPLLLYGYGSYGHSSDPFFSSKYLSLLDRGFVFAIAHIRGGEEMGRKWYDEGRLFNKMNTFTDFIACSEFLINNKYAEKDHLYAYGGSAGGLLIGAIVNLRPDLYDGVIAAVPFVDVITTMMDESIPLTTGEYDEWGNPNNKDAYDYMLSYSPVDNVSSKEYPAILATTGFHDSQVQYWEPAKWIAKLRDYNTGNKPILLSVNMDAGHGGASGRFEIYRESALEFAFFLDLAGIHE